MVFMAGRAGASIWLETTVSPCLATNCVMFAEIGMLRRRVRLLETKKKKKNRRKKQHLEIGDRKKVFLRS